MSPVFFSCIICGDIVQSGDRDSEVSWLAEFRAGKYLLFVSEQPCSAVEVLIVATELKYSLAQVTFESPGCLALASIMIRTGPST